MLKHRRYQMLCLVALIAWTVLFSKESFYFIGAMSIALIFFLRCLYGVLYLSDAYFGSTITAGLGKGVTLSIDDGPNKESTLEILEILKRHKITAVFFVIGKNIETDPSMLIKIHQQGHLIGNHSFSHSKLWPLQSKKALLKDLTKCNMLVYKYLKIFPAWFRPPYGVMNPNIAHAVKSFGFKTIGWNLRTFDAGPQQQVKISRKIQRGIKKGSIVLLHDQSKSIPLLKEIIEICTKKGLKFDHPEQTFSESAYRSLS